MGGVPFSFWCFLYQYLVVLGGIWRQVQLEAGSIHGYLFIWLIIHSSSIKVALFPSLEVYITTGMFWLSCANKVSINSGECGIYWHVAKWSTYQYKLCHTCGNFGAPSVISGLFWTYVHKLYFWCDRCLYLFWLLICCTLTSPQPPRFSPRCLSPFWLCSGDSYLLVPGCSSVQEPILPFISIQQLTDLFKVCRSQVDSQSEETIDGPISKDWSTQTWL